ncbi:MAG TPA: S41 family peptidase [Solirubrobacteraceae bacterium]|jgi:carboxyl-terminal processing protease
MEPSRRTPLITLLAVLAPVFLIAGIWIGGHPHGLPGFMRTLFVANHETEVIDEAIDRISSDYYRPVKRSELASSSIAGAVSSLHDRFSNYLTPGEYKDFGRSGSFSGIGISVLPVRLGLLVEQVFDSSPAARAGLREGELIIAVAGRSLKGLSSGASTALIMGRAGTDVKLTLLRHSHTRTVTITRATITEPVVASKASTVHGVKLGVVALGMFSSGAHTELREAVNRVLKEGARGLVLDLRHNGGGLVSEAQLIASIFIDSGVIVSTRGRTQAPLTLRALGGAISSAIPLVVLVDRDTASAAEILTAALQDHHRAIIVGTHTFGKGVFQQVEELPNGGALDITVGEYFTPDGRNLGGGGVKEGAGITPDVSLGSGVDGARGMAVALRTLAAKVK